MTAACHVGWPRELASSGSPRRVVPDDASPAPLPDGWFSPRERVPRRDQPVRIWTVDGVDRAARFAVAHTDDWPSGAGWAVHNGQELLPFASVQSWSPDPDTPRPAPPPAAAPAPEPPPPEPEPAPASPTPAIARELVVQVEHVGRLLRRLPEPHLGWTPHPMVPPLGVLALRLVRVVARMDWILDLDYLEILFEPDLPQFATVNEIVSTFDANASSVKSLAGALTADALRQPWRLERDGQVVSDVPRGDALRTFGLTPLAYYRGEAALMMSALGVDLPLPDPVWRFKDHPHWSPAG